LAHSDGAPQTKTNITLLGQYKAANFAIQSDGQAALSPPATVRSRGPGAREVLPSPMLAKAGPADDDLTASARMTT